MSNYSKEELREQLKKWLKDPALLGHVRKFLGGQGLSDAKIANWDKQGRDIPDTFFEGFALHYCLTSGSFDALAAQKTQVLARDCYQLFVVSPERDNEGNHNCTVYRYWTDVGRYTQDSREVYLTHKTWSTGSADQKDTIWDISTNRPHNNIRHLNDHELAVSWLIEDSKPQDYGYQVHLRGTVSSRPPQNQRHEYLGGLTVVPVERLVLIASIPRSLLKPSQDILEESPYKRPQCLEFLADGAPIPILEGFLQKRLERRWLSPWFDNRGPAKIWQSNAALLPKKLQDLALGKGSSLENDKNVAYFIEVQSPAPYLYYSLVFELPGTTE